ncbi:MAG TPA: YkgJ family cysteine cluster protein [Candidatus Bilamarchaeaceae archaeon]|nr:YkgJ family cysteine cluster protein [Candidatus Bilamarchaeaceae archaeon]
MPNPCSLCAAHCCKNYLITLTSFDVLRIMQETGKKPGEFVQLVPARILNPDNEAILECYEGKERYEYLLTFYSHPCYFLKDNRCSIHEIAPLACRLYPYNANGKMVPRALCPTIPKLLFRLKGADIRVQQYEKQMEAYKKIVAKWNVRHGKKEDCLEFLLKETANHTNY